MDGEQQAFENYPQWLLSCAAFSCAALALLGLPANLVTAVALATCRKVRNATTAFVINLSVADLLFCAFNLPLAASNFGHGRWVHGPVLCALLPFVRYANVAVSLFSVTAITVNRYLLVVHPSSYESVYTPAKVGLMIATIWTVSFGTLVPTLAGKWGTFGFDQQVGTCSILPVDNRSPKSFLFIVGFLIPCVVIVFCYARILLVVRRVAARVHRHDRPLSSTSIPPSSSRDMRLLHMVVVILANFIVCYLPITLVKVLGVERSQPVLNVAAYLLMYTTACTNPVVYVVMSREYRRAYRRLLNCGVVPNTGSYRVSGTGLR